MAKSRRRTQARQKESFSNWQQYVLGLFILISVMTFSALYLLESATKPLVQLKERAIEVAKDYTEIAEVEQVSIYHGQESYYNVQGKTESGQEVFVLVPERSSEIFVYQTSDGISQEEAEQKARENGADSPDKTVLGYAQGQPIWEVKSGSSYYLIDFKTGELIKKEGL